MYLRDARHLDKFLYTLSDERFYEPLENHYKPSQEYLSIVASLIDACSTEWLTTRDGLWFHVYTKQVRLPLQGWKVHVSAVLVNAAAIIGSVARIALKNTIPFKFALDKNILSLMTSKRWDRGGSGKFITLYPSDQASFESLLEQLYTELQHEEGPYILSDKRYKDCKILYYRYGGIRPETRLNMRGERVPVLLTPRGDAVPDIRTPYFSPPSWAPDPFVQAASKDRGDLTLNDGKYVVTKALSFSNSGGVYLAEEFATGKTVLIKEARLHTLQDGRGNDAISLLTKEHQILDFLKDTGIAPVPIESFYDWENLFLVEEYVEGVDIRELMLGQSPLMLVNPSSSDTTRFYDTFCRIFTTFAAALEILHERGIVFGDLSANNLRIDPTSYSVRLIDLEAARRLGVDDASLLYTPGFRDPLSLHVPSGIKDDLYALAAIMLYTIFPIHALSSLRQDLYSSVLMRILLDVGWSETPVFEVISGLSKGETTCSQVSAILAKPARLSPPRYHRTIDVETCSSLAQNLGSFICSTMRTDQGSLFPADPYLGRTNALSLGFGACGVLFALKKCDYDIPQKALMWLEEKLDSVKTGDLPPGLFTGTAGIAWSLYDLGFHERAAIFMKMANESPLVSDHHSYLYGMAGVGMANLYMYLRTHEQSYLSIAEHLAERLLRTAQQSDSGLFWESDNLVHLGYGYGQSGVALFLLRLSQTTGKETYRAQGRQAIAFDLSNGVESEAGVLSFPRGVGDFTLDPYIEEGSAGVARVALRFGLWDEAGPILADIHRKYSVYAGLLYGLSGFLDVLTDAFVLSHETRFQEMAKRPLSGLSDLFLIKDPSGIATPGDGLLRFSCDYATGAAGVMRTMYRFAYRARADFTLDELMPPDPSPLGAGEWTQSVPV